MFGTVALAVASPIVVLNFPSAGKWLGALAGGWIFASRTFLAWLEDRSVEDARRAQEEFDCEVLGIPPNPAIPSGISLEKVVAAAERYRKPERLRAWYPTETLTDGPRDAMICQRSSVAWGQRMHTEYLVLVAFLAVGVAAGGAGVGIAEDLKLEDYLVAILLPSLPALLDIVDLAQSHLRAAVVKGDLERQMTELLSRDGTIDEKVCRAFQDRIFIQRGADPVVAELYYKVRRKAYERHMKEAAATLAQRA